MANDFLEYALADKTNLFKIVDEIWWKSWNFDFFSQSLFSDCPWWIIISGYKLSQLSIHPTYNSKLRGIVHQNNFCYNSDHQDTSHGIFLQNWDGYHSWKPMLKSVLVNKDFLTWCLVAWWLCCQSETRFENSQQDWGIFRIRLQISHPPKQKYCHLEEIFIIGCTGSYNFEGLRGKTAVTPLLMHWSYCSLALSHRFDFQCSQWMTFLFQCLVLPVNCMIKFDSNQVTNHSWQ